MGNILNILFDAGCQSLGFVSDRIWIISWYPGNWPGISLPRKLSFSPFSVRIIAIRSINWINSIERTSFSTLERNLYAIVQRLDALSNFPLEKIARFQCASKLRKTDSWCDELFIIASRTAYYNIRSSLRHCTRYALFRTIESDFFAPRAHSLLVISIHCSFLSEYISRSILIREGVRYSKRSDPIRASKWKSCVGKKLGRKMKKLPGAARRGRLQCNRGSNALPRALNAALDGMASDARGKRGEQLGSALCHRPPLAQLFPSFSFFFAFFSRCTRGHPPVLTPTCTFTYIHIYNGNTRLAADRNSKGWLGDNGWRERGERGSAQRALRPSDSQRARTRARGFKSWLTG